MGFVDLSRITAEAITDALLKFLKDCGLDLSFWWGQGYDGASNMAGSISGVQAQIRSLYPKAVFVHCAAHNLNLALNDASSVEAVSFAMQLIKEITAFIANSPKRSEMFKETIQQLSGLSKNAHSKLIRLCTTRWVERHQSVQRFWELLTGIVSFLKLFSMDKTVPTGDRNKAKGMLTNLTQFEVIFAISMLNDISSNFVMLSSNLQSTAVDLVGCHDRIQQCLQHLTDKQEEQRIFDHSIEIGILERGCDFQQALPFNKEYTSAGVYYREAVYSKYMTELICQIRMQFSTITRLVFHLQRLVPGHFGDDLDVIRAIYEFYHEDLGECTETEFMAQYNMWKYQFQNPSVAKPITALESLVLCTQFEPAVKRALQILAMLPVSTATAERSFSTLRRLKTYLRGTMGTERTTALALLNIDREVTIDVDEVLSLFRQQSHRINI